MADTKISLAKLLQDLANDKEKYHLPVSSSTKYAIEKIIAANDSSYYEALPAEIKEKIQDWVRTYREGIPLGFLSNLGREDLSGTMRAFIALMGWEERAG